MVGTKEHPVRDVHVHGIKMEHTKTTFLKPYMVPSGGDWSVHRNAMVYVEGTENLLIEECVFSQPGGNGLFIRLVDVFSHYCTLFETKEH